MAKDDLIKVNAYFFIFFFRFLLRKPRVTATMVAQQIISSFPPIPPPLPINSKYHRSNSGGKRSKKRYELYSFYQAFHTV